MAAARKSQSQVLSQWVSVYSGKPVKRNAKTGKVVTKRPKTPTQEERNRRIAKAISKRAGVMCILCDEFIYGDWGSKESKDIDAIIQHFDSKHESEAAIVALSQNLDSIKDIIKKAKIEKAEQAYAHTNGHKFKDGKVYHLKNQYGGWKCGYYTYGYRQKTSTKRWGDIPLKDRCKNCHKNSVGG